MRSIKSKIKPLLTSLREKKRYLAFEVISESKINDFQSLNKEIQEKSLQFLGELGYAKAGIIMLKDKYNKNTQRGLLKVSHKHLDNIRAALTLIQHVEGKKAIVRSVGASGILGKAETRYITSTS